MNVSRRSSKATPVLLLTVVCMVATPALAAPDVGKAAPAFSLRDREGALFSLGDVAYAGPARAHQPKHVVVVDFFRTDCKPCFKVLPKLVALHKQYKDRPVKLLLVALLEDDEGQEKLDAFLKKTPLPFPVLVDAYGVAGKKYVRKGNSYSIPALFVIDRQGTLRAHIKGVDDKSQHKLQPLINELLAKH